MGKTIKLKVEISQNDNEAIWYKETTKTCPCCHKEIENVREVIGVMPIKKWNEFYQRCKPRENW